MSHIIGDASDKMREAIENVSCQCGHVRDDHENREGKCKHVVNMIIGFKRTKKSKKMLTEEELNKIRKAKKDGKIIPVYGDVSCCGKYRPLITRAGYTDNAFAEIFGGTPAVYNPPPEGTAVSGKPADPKPKDLTTVESVTLINPSAGLPPVQGAEFTEEVQDLEGRNFVKPEHQKQVLSAPHKPKVATVTNAAALITEVLKMPVFGSGYSNWIKALNGHVISAKALGENPALFLEKYDWLMINLAGTDLGISDYIRKQLGSSSDTKIIVNNDYSVEILQNMLMSIENASLYRYIKDLIAADLVFAQEPYQLQAVNYIISWNKAKAAEANIKAHHPITTMISHPVDTKTLKQFAVDDLSQRSPTIGVMYHRLDGNVYIPAMITRWQPLSWFNGMQPLTYLYSYVGKSNIYASEDRLFDGYHEHLDFGRFVQMFVPNIAAFDYYTIHSHSRFSSECACFKVPLVSTTHSFNARVLFPENVADYSNWEALRLKLGRVVSDEKYWQQCVDYAYEQVEQFNLDNSIAKLSTVMEIVEKRK